MNPCTYAATYIAICVFSIDIQKKIKEVTDYVVICFSIRYQENKKVSMLASDQKREMEKWATSPNLILIFNWLG